MARLKVDSWWSKNFQGACPAIELHDLHVLANPKTWEFVLVIRCFLRWLRDWAIFAGFRSPLCVCIYIYPFCVCIYIYIFPLYMARIVSYQHKLALGSPKAGFKEWTWRWPCGHEGLLRPKILPPSRKAIWMPWTWLTVVARTCGSHNESVKPENTISQYPLSITVCFFISSRIAFLTGPLLPS